MFVTVNSYACDSTLNLLHHTCMRVTVHSTCYITHTCLLQRTQLSATTPMLGTEQEG